MSQDFKNNGAWSLMMSMAKDDSIVKHHSVYSPIPYKLNRCIGLSAVEKVILIDLIGYMGNSRSCYPIIEDIALNCGITHTTVEKHIKSLEEKRFISVMRRHNNSYLLKDYFHANPYIVLSEILHKFKKRIQSTNYLNERSQALFIKSIIQSSYYSEAISKMLKIYDRGVRYGIQYGTWISKYHVELVKFIDGIFEIMKTQYPFLYEMGRQNKTFKYIIDNY